MDRLSGGLYQPLFVAAVLYAVLYIAAQVAGNRGDGSVRERLLDLAFLVGLLAAAWTAVLLLIALVSETDLVYDLIVIVLVVVAFFALLLFLLFGSFEFVLSRFGRRRSQREG